MSKGIFVEGMTMPKDCSICPFNHFEPGFGEQCYILNLTTSDSFVGNVPFKFRHPKCPLREIVIKKVED